MLQSSDKFAKTRNWRKRSLKQSSIDERKDHGITCAAAFRPDSSDSYRIRRD